VFISTFHLIGKEIHIFTNHGGKYTAISGNLLIGTARRTMKTSSLHTIFIYISDTASVLRMLRKKYRLMIFLALEMISVIVNF